MDDGSLRSEGSRREVVRSLRGLRVVVLILSFSLACTAVTNLFSSSTATDGANVIVNEVMPVPPEGGAAWVELANRGSQAVDLAGASLSDLDDNAFVFPDSTPAIRPGDFVVVVFDGEGTTDDLQFEAGRLVLHSPEELVDPFEPGGDQLALFAASGPDAESMLDFVAWGVPADEDEALAVEAGIWQSGAYVSQEPGGEVKGEGMPGVALGLYPEKNPDHLESWVVYAPGDTTQGARNGVPRPQVLVPGDGAELLQQDFRLSWYSVGFASRYRFQLASSTDFETPVVDITLEEAIFAPQDPPPAGDYFWRVQAEGEQGEWSGFTDPVTLTVLEAENLILPEPPVEENNPFAADGSSARRARPAADEARQSETWQVEYLNNLRPVLQRKDTNMICWDGDEESGDRRPWDGPHPDSPGNHSSHGRKYCARASIAMINHFYGGDLSQDRISYEHFGWDSWPVGDMGHNVGLHIPDGADLLSWSLNSATVRLTNHKPSFEEIQDWAREGVPVLSGIPGHAIVLRGWAIYEGDSSTTPAGTRFVIFNDPWDGRMHVQTYDSLNLTNMRVPLGDPTGRQQEGSVTQDTDGDGIVDFDEVERFRTDPNAVDTDDDCVPDLEDMHSFHYTTHNQFSPSVADHDGDGLWAQEDEDNDGGGTIDGNEDTNFNGHLDSGETSNFDQSDDRAGGPCSQTGQAPSATATPTATTQPTQEPVGAGCQAQTEDQQGDTFNRDTQEPQQAAGADIVRMASRCEADKLLVSVWLADPGLADMEVYSSAVEILLRGSSGQDVLSALWQLHAGEVTREIRYPQTGEVVDGTPVISINKEEDRARVDYEIEPPGEDRPFLLFGRSYYKAGQTTAFLGDEASMESRIDPP